MAARNLKPLTENAVLENYSRSTLHSPSLHRHGNGMKLFSPALPPWQMLRGFFDEVMAGQE
jgi:hypothetical protein